MKIYTIFNRKKPHQTWVKAVILNQRRFCSLVDLETFLVVTTIVQGCCYTPHNVQDSTLQTRIIWLKMPTRSKERKQIQTYNKKYRKVISKQVFMYLYSKKKKIWKSNIIVSIINLMTTLNSPFNICSAITDTISLSISTVMSTSSFPIMRCWKDTVRKRGSWL